MEGTPQRGKPQGVKSEGDVVLGEEGEKRGRDKKSAANQAAAADNGGTKKASNTEYRIQELVAPLGSQERVEGE